MTLQPEGGGMPHTDEGTLALSVHRGDREAVERLVSGYQDALFSYAFHLMADREEARDVTQETFIRAYRTLSAEYDEARCRSLALRPWLFRMLRNLALNRLRARRRMDAAVSALADEPVAGNAPPAPWDRVRLAQALRRLDPGDREVILLRFMEEMRYADIASVCGGAEAVLRGRVFRALCKLRVIMKEEDPHALP
jgi:RNA polymerase sigma-70 factor (ECF subfamily)